MNNDKLRKLCEEVKELDGMYGVETSQDHLKSALHYLARYRTAVPKLLDEVDMGKGMLGEAMALLGEERVKHSDLKQKIEEMRGHIKHEVKHGTGYAKHFRDLFNELFPEEE